jgi:hypothetical protein
MDVTISSGTTEMVHEYMSALLESCAIQNTNTFLEFLCISAVWKGLPF